MVHRVPCTISQVVSNMLCPLDAGLIVVRLVLTSVVLGIHGEMSANRLITRRHEDPDHQIREAECQIVRTIVLLSDQMDLREIAWSLDVVENPRYPDTKLPMNELLAPRLDQIGPGNRENMAAMQRRISRETDLLLKPQCLRQRQRQRQPSILNAQHALSRQNR